jgi:hypothetical protein
VVVAMTRVELGSDLVMRCADCDRWDLREAALVDQDGVVLLRGSACPHCHRHRADFDEFDEAPLRSFGPFDSFDSFDDHTAVGFDSRIRW